MNLRNHSSLHKLFYSLQNQLEQMFGNDRFVWNQMLAMMNERYQNNKDLPFLGKFKLNY
ncbi:helix-turn-helix domain-containing protein, partial [Lactobacillus helveticus]